MRRRARAAVSSATQEGNRAGAMAEDVREIAAQTSQSSNTARAALNAAVGTNGNGVGVLAKERG